MSETVERQSKAIRLRGDDIHARAVDVQNSNSLSAEDGVALQRSRFPRGLSFTFSESFARYPDTAESGETYDLEASVPLIGDQVEIPAQE